MGDICEFGDALRNVIAKTSYCLGGGGGLGGGTLGGLVGGPGPGYFYNFF